ncbi:MAG: hypothetical protein MK135_16880 [Polyangiaceae bacterium]|nr:hypothetical protein [Polyangiaceae bacterium]
MKKTSALILLVLAPACGEVHYIGHTGGEFRQADTGSISSEAALEKAQPYLAATQEARCAATKQENSKWCQTPGAVHIVQKGKHYYLSQTDYPYKTFHAYLHYAVKVHVKTGDVTPYKE